MMKRLSAWTIIALAVVACAGGCTSREEREERAAVDTVVGQVDARNMVSSSGVIAFRTGPLQEGRAVLVVNCDAAFWVKDGTVYVVNDRAKAIAPGLEQAPAEITYEAVVSVAD